MTRLTLSIGLLLAAAITLPQTLTAQNNEAQEKPAAESKDYRGPLPFYYGKLGLNDEQKELFYGIQDEYQKQIDTLRKQIAKLEQERDAKMEEHLTPGQKLRLKELREEARKKAEEQQAKEQAAVESVDQ